MPEAEEITKFYFSTKPVPDKIGWTSVTLESPMSPFDTLPSAQYVGEDAAERLWRKAFNMAAGMTQDVQQKEAAMLKALDPPTWVVPVELSVAQSMPRPGIQKLVCTLECVPTKLMGGTRGKQAAKNQLRLLDWFVQRCMTVYAVQAEQGDLS
jgi:hypothetical protein